MVYIVFMTRMSQNIRAFLLLLLCEYIEIIHKHLPQDSSGKELKKEYSRRKANIHNRLSVPLSKSTEGKNRMHRIADGLIFRWTPRPYCPLCKQKIIYVTY